MEAATIEITQKVTYDVFCRLAGGEVDQLRGALGGDLPQNLVVLFVGTEIFAKKYFPECVLYVPGADFITIDVLV